MHEGHVLFAQVASEQFGLDKVLILPEVKPRYKDNVTEALHREAMIQLAVMSADADLELLSLPEIESHTIAEVIARVHELFPDDEYYMLMGSDVFRTVPTWGSRDDEMGSIADIADKVGLIVGIQSMAEIAELKDIATQEKLNVRFIESPLNALSSRKIRADIAGGKFAHGLNDNVIKYINEQKLYK